MNFSSYKTNTLSPYLIDTRRYIHAHPELSWAEMETTAFIEKELRRIGITEIAKPLSSGLVASIHGRKGAGRCIALRADIDALPIEEKNSCTYKSQNEGVMHACGHDVHTTCLLGAAQYLVIHREEWAGTIKLIFQPSEEKQPSGAEAMIEAGVLENPKVEAILGLHVTPELEVGKLGFRTGQFMASADEIYLTVIGKGGHGASPQFCVDPIVLSAHIILGLQQIVSRMADPKTPTVLTFGDIQGNGATNIIPEKVEIKGTLRTFDEIWRREAQQKIKDVSIGIARSFGGECIVHIPEGIPFVYNEEALTEQIKGIAISKFGQNTVVDMPLRMGAEDFSYYGHKTAASFFRLGTGNSEKGTTVTVHNPHFDIDEDALVIGSSAMVEFALGLLGDKS